jgi:CheY-like chemotaxis protein
MARVLIVEDERPILELLDDFLTVEGFGTILAGNGLLGAELARTEQPDLILMDLMLPVMDGLAVIRALKRSPDTWSIPIVAMSANRALLRTCADLPVAETVRKPFDLDHLLDVVLALTSAEPAALVS